MVQKYRSPDVTMREYSGPEKKKNPGQKYSASGNASSCLRLAVVQYRTHHFRKTLEAAENELIPDPIQ